MITMPQKIICSECQTVLYEGLELESPSEIIQRNNGTCPKCGKKLDYDTNNLDLKINQDD
jgi:RNase P subunit RPR2